MYRLVLPLFVIAALLALVACPSEPAGDDDDTVVEDDDDSARPDDDDSVVQDDDDSVIPPDDDDSDCVEVRVCGWDAGQEMFACGATDTAPAGTPDCTGDWYADCGPQSGGTTCCDDDGILNYCYYESGDIHFDVEKCPYDCI